MSTQDAEHQESNEQPAEQQYFVVSSSSGKGSRRRLHTDEYCLALHQGRNQRRAAPEEVERLETCRRCTEEFEQDGADWSAYRALRDAAREAGDD